MLVINELRVVGSGLHTPLNFSWSTPPPMGEHKGAWKSVTVYSKSTPSSVDV